MLVLLPANMLPASTREPEDAAPGEVARLSARMTRGCPGAATATCSDLSGENEMDQ